VAAPVALAFLQYLAGVAPSPTVIPTSTPTATPSTTATATKSPSATPTK
jgi:hypothetical protein